MKKLLLGSMALAAMFATPAVAADMPAKAAPPPPVVLYNWTGIYAGFSAGYAWQDFDWAFNPPVPGGVHQAYSFDTDNWIFDGHGGVQVQFGWLVIGREPHSPGGVDDAPLDLAADRGLLRRCPGGCRDPDDVDHRTG